MEGVNCTETTDLDRLDISEESVVIWGLLRGTSVRVLVQALYLDELKELLQQAEEQEGPKI